MNPGNFWDHFRGSRKLLENFINFALGFHQHISVFFEINLVSKVNLVLVSRRDNLDALEFHALEEIFDLLNEYLLFCPGENKENQSFLFDLFIF